MGNATVALRTQGGYQNTRELLEAVQRGDGMARAVWEKSMHALAAGMVSLINAFDPRDIILGGGIAAGAWELVMAGVRPHLNASEWCPTGERVRIVQAKLGEWAGAYGAAKTARLGALRVPTHDALPDNERALLPELGSRA